MPGPGSVSVPRGYSCGSGPEALDAAPGLLLVEDDAALRQMMTWDLSELGYIVHPVGTCREAIDVCAAAKLQVGVVDVGLPDGDGVELAVRLMGMVPGLQVVFCTGGQEELTRKRAPPECLAVLAKPVQLRHVHSLLRSALGRVGLDGEGKRPAEAKVYGPLTGLGL